MLGLERRIGLEGRLSQLVKEARSLVDGATVDQVGGLWRALGLVDQELEATAGSGERRRELRRLRREAGLLVAHAHARAVLARDFGDHIVGP